MGYSEGSLFQKLGIQEVGNPEVKRVRLSEGSLICNERAFFNPTTSLIHFWIIEPRNHEPLFILGLTNLRSNEPFSLPD